MAHSYLKSGPIRVGVLFSQTGATAVAEQPELQGTLLAIEEINRAGGISGAPIEPVVYDPRSEPAQYKAAAERLFSTDGVRLIFGGYMSSCRKAVMPTVEAFRGLLFYPTMYEGYEYSRNCIYTGAAPNQNLLPLARYLFDNCGNRFVLVGSNYVFPYETNRIFTDLVAQAGGKVLDEIYVPVDARAEDFAKSMRQIRRLAPDVILSTVVGRATVTLYEAYHAEGFDPAVMPIASVTTSEAEVAQMSRAAAEGHIVSAPFFESLNIPDASRFVALFKARFGAEAPVTSSAEAAYVQVHLVAKAIAKAGSTEPAHIYAALRDSEFDAPQGRIKLDAETHHTFLWPRIAKLDADGRFQVVWNSKLPVKPDPYRVVQGLAESWDEVGALLRV